MIEKLYPTLPTAPLDATYQETYHQNRVRSYYEELSKIKGKYSIKHEKHSRILSRFLWVGACSNGFGCCLWCRWGW